MIEMFALWPWALIFCVELLCRKISVQRLQVTKARLFKGKISRFLVPPFGSRTPSKNGTLHRILQKFCKHKMVHRSIYKVHLFTKCRPKDSCARYKHVYVCVYCSYSSYICLSVLPEDVGFLPIGSKHCCWQLSIVTWSSTASQLVW